jgi:hypothetical protein
MTTNITLEGFDKQDVSLFSAVTFAAGDDKKKTRTFSGIAYSGDIVTDQGYWDSVVFDLTGISFSHERMPVLKNHSQDKILGYTTNFSIGENLSVSGTFLESSEEAAQIIKMADEGYPWQLSVHIRPGVIRRLERGDSEIVNNKVVVGPAVIFKQSTIREVSFCAVGADRGTSATVFTAAAPNTQPKKEVVMPDITNPTPPGDRDLALHALSEEKAVFAAQVETLKVNNTRLTGEAAELRDKLKSSEFELASLKDSLERTRKETEDLRAEKAKFTQSTREAILTEDYKRLGLVFNAKDEAIAVVLLAEENVFQAYRNALGTIQKVPVTPPGGAFEPITQQPDDNEASKFQLISIEEAAKKRAANTQGVN